MKSDGLLKPVVGAALIAIVLYAISYTAIEHRRTRKGPWRVAVTNDASGAPALLINQPALGITNVEIRFPDARPTTNFSPATLVFAEPREVPYDAPFGRCLFMDTTFLPGTIVLKAFGHEIQLIPRVLTIDRREQPWHSRMTISLGATTNSAEATVPAR